MRAALSLALVLVCGPSFAQGLLPHSGSASPTRADVASSYTATPVALGALGSCAALAGTYASVDSTTAQPYYCNGVEWSPVITAKTLPDDVVAAVLGADLSLNKLVLTSTSPTADALVLAGEGRLRFSPNNPNAYAQWDLNIGVKFASAIANAPGASLWTDSLISRQGDRSVRVDQAQGLGLTPQSSIGTCDNTTGSGHSREGDVKALSGASLSARTRLCMCTSDGSGTPAYAWLNVTTGTVGTSTACNN